MPYQNISAEISEEQVKSITTELVQISAQVPFVINLSIEEIRELPKMGDKTMPFVEKVVHIAPQHPMILPEYVDISEIDRDYILAKRLKQILDVIEPITEKIRDTYHAVGAEAYFASRLFYAAAQVAARANVPGADTVVAELGKRFDRPALSTGNTGKEKSQPA